MELLQDIRQKLVNMGKEILRNNLTIGTWGNISCKVAAENYVMITPSCMSYDILSAEDIVAIDLAGKAISGIRKPSTELPLHLAIYQAREDVQAIIHTHSVCATAMAAARKEIPGAVEDLIQIVGGNVRVSEYASSGSEKLGMSVVNALKDRNAVLMANHGILGVGKDLEEALKVCQVVEKTAKITLLAQLVGGVVELSEVEMNKLRRFYLDNYGQDK